MSARASETDAPRSHLVFGVWGRGGREEGLEMIMIMIDVAHGPKWVFAAAHGTFPGVTLKWRSHSESTAGDKRMEIKR